MNKEVLNKKWNDYPTDTIYLWNGDEIFRISEGTGDNLSEEDVENGYKDYWITEYASTEYINGGQWLEKEFIADLDYTIQGVLNRLMECDLWEDNWEIIDEYLGENLLNEMQNYHIAVNSISRLIDKIERRGE